MLKLREAHEHVIKTSAGQRPANAMAGTTSPRAYSSPSLSSTTVDEHGASLSVWIELANASETDRPLDAARAYGRDVEARIDSKNTWTYERAVERIAHIRTLYERGGDPSDFETYLADLRDRHRRKIKFTRLLDEAGLTEPASRKGSGPVDAERGGSGARLHH